MVIAKGTITAAEFIMTVRNMKDLDNLTFTKEKIVIGGLLSSWGLISQKTEMNTFSHNQFQYESNSVIKESPYNHPKNPSDLK